MKNSNFIIALVCAILCAVSCGIRLWFEYGVLALACYAAVIVALPFSSLVHELGHCLFGAMAKIKAKPSFSLAGASSCKIIPKTEEGLRGRLIFTTFGGLAVNCVFAVIGALACFAVIPVFLSVFLPASAYLIILNAIPAELSAGKTDGLVLSELIKNSDEAKVMLAVLTVQAQVLGGKPLKDVDEKLLTDLPVIREDDLSYISLTELRYEYYKAKGDESNAIKYKMRFEQLQEYLS